MQITVVSLCVVTLSFISFHLCAPVLVAHDKPHDFTRGTIHHVEESSLSQVTLSTLKRMYHILHCEKQVLLGKLYKINRIWILEDFEYIESQTINSHFTIQK